MFASAVYDFQVALDNLELTGFDSMELAEIMLGKDVEFKEYDETAADDVQLVTCPKCGYVFPK